MVATFLGVIGSESFDQFVFRHQRHEAQRHALSGLRGFGEMISCANPCVARMKEIVTHLSRFEPPGPRVPQHVAFGTFTPQQSRFRSFALVVPGPLVLVEEGVAAEASDALLAFTLGHELAHIALGHPAKDLRWGTLARRLGGDLVERVLGQWHGRELAADALGARWAAAAGWPEGATQLFQILFEQARRAGRRADAFPPEEQSDRFLRRRTHRHPTLAERMRALGIEVPSWDAPPSRPRRRPPRHPPRPKPRRRSRSKRARRRAAKRRRRQRRERKRNRRKR